MTNSLAAPNWSDRCASRLRAYGYNRTPVITKMNKGIKDFRHFFTPNTFPYIDE
ncbi:MAG TPA: hypothetical protein V6C91_01410 [Coleofasciculaceae cyanobacterium]